MQAFHSQTHTGSVTHLLQINTPLRLLVEHEIFRLTVWANTTNDPKRGADHVGTTERAMQEARESFAVRRSL
jgi:phosphatidylinositol 4-kinase